MSLLSTKKTLAGKVLKNEICISGSKKRNDLATVLVRAIDEVGGRMHADNDVDALPGIPSA